MSLRLFNSLTRKLEVFKPLIPGRVSIYTCGPTVYDSSHIGHARSFMVWDTLVRFLRHRDYEVKWVRNITDIDDKIINRASQQGITPEQLARREIFKFWRDMCALNIAWPDLEPRATESLPQMYEFIAGLIKGGYAYATAGGDVYFRVAACTSYGQLKALAEVQDCLARVEQADGKESSRDFALWKACPPDDYGFASPWSYGRPGWHLECSAMAAAHLGPTIDIHGGGEDLLFPHHENEIAQSECLHGCTFANYWLHNGLIFIQGRKMSKSDGNFVTVAEALRDHSANAIRFFVLSAHYRQALNYTTEALQSAEAAQQRLLSAVTVECNFPSEEGDSTDEQLADFTAALEDDFNTPRALACLFDLLKEINKGADNLRGALKTGLKVLGFLLSEPLTQRAASVSTAARDALMLELRTTAKMNRDYATADRIRAAFAADGLTIIDSADGSSLITQRV